METMSECSDLYCAVYVPANEDNEEIGLIFHTVPEAVSLCKEYKSRGARFRSFLCLTEAESFSHGLVPGTPRLVAVSTDPYPSPVCDDGGSTPFPTLKLPELSRFRKVIDAGDMPSFEEMVLANPRYLINCSSDTPTILQTSMRYNALHVASRVGNAEVVCRILQLIDDADCQFLKRLYPGDCVDTYTERRRYLLDSFLNTPDRVINETPLHFAVKWGHRNIVELMVGYSICRRNVRNKYNETPADVLCSRVKDKVDEELGELKRDILSLLRKCRHTFGSD